MQRATISTVASFLALALAACTDTAPPSSPNRPPPAARATLADGDDVQLDVPLAGLTAAELDRFNRGRAVFSRVFTDARGTRPIVQLGRLRELPRRTVSWWNRRRLGRRHRDARWASYRYNVRRSHALRRRRDPASHDSNYYRRHIQGTSPRQCRLSPERSSDIALPRHSLASVSSRRFPRVPSKRSPIQPMRMATACAVAPVSPTESFCALAGKRPTRHCLGSTPAHFRTKWGSRAPSRSPSSCSSALPFHSRRPSRRPSWVPSSVTRISH